MLPPGMTGTETFEGHPASFKGTVFLYSFQPVGAASGGKAAFGAKKGGNGSLVEPDDRNEQYGE